MAVKYTASDKELFLQIITKFPIIKNKRTDAYSIEKKKKAWGNIVAEFNNAGNEQRTVIQLKRLWDKMKRNRKGILAGGRRELLATGGGPPAPIPPPQSEIDDLLPILKFEIQDVDDSDGTILNGNLGGSVEEIGARQEINLEKDTTATSTEQPVTDEDVSPVTATTIANSRRAKKRQHSQLDAITNARLQLIQREREHIEELHAIRMEEACFAREAARFRMLQEEAKLSYLFLFAEINGLYTYYMIHCFRLLQLK